MKYNSDFIGDFHADEEPQLPPRSHLYCLAPVASGTSEVESAAGFATAYPVQPANVWLVAGTFAVMKTVAPATYEPLPLPLTTVR